MTRPVSLWWRCAPVLFLGTLGCAASTLKPNPESYTEMKEHTMQTPTADKERFPPHPGKIIFRTAWNNTVKVESAAEVPDNIKFIYYTADHIETSDHDAAKTREPIVEIETSSYDADGKLTDPARAVRYSITQYGLHHQELRHTTASAPPPRP